MESYYTFRMAYIEAYKTKNAFGKIIIPDESDIEDEYSQYVNAYKQAHGQPSQTDSLIVANLRAHLEYYRKEFEETTRGDGAGILGMIALLEEIFSLQKPI